MCDSIDRVLALWLEICGIDAFTDYVEKLLTEVHHLCEIN